jgi:hypothetical protein
LRPAAAAAAMSARPQEAEVVKHPQAAVEAAKQAWCRGYDPAAGSAAVSADPVRRPAEWSGARGPLVAAAEAAMKAG